MRITSRQLNEGCKVPFGYGIAYRDLRYHQNIYYLFPLNLIIAFFRNLYSNMLFFWPQKLDKMKNKLELNLRLQRKGMYNKGYSDGYDKGGKEQYEKGFKEGQENILELSKRYFKTSTVTEKAKEKV